MRSKAPSFTLSLVMARSPAGTGQAAQGMLGSGFVVVRVKVDCRPCVRPPVLLLLLLLPPSLPPVSLPLLKLPFCPYPPPHVPLLTLEHLDGDSGLVILVRGEGLALLDRNSVVAGDKFGHHTAHCLDAQGQRSDVNDDHAAIIVNVCKVRECEKKMGEALRVEWVASRGMKTGVVVHR